MPDAGRHAGDGRVADATARPALVHPGLGTQTTPCRTTRSSSWPTTSRRTLRASYTLGWWQNDAERASASYLRDAAGKPVYSGPINIGGRSYTVTPGRLPADAARPAAHHARPVGQDAHATGEWDWELAASLYDYARDLHAPPTVALPAAAAGGAGRITDQTAPAGTRWRCKGTGGRGAGGAHVVDFGMQHDATAAHAACRHAGNWLDGAPTRASRRSTGDTDAHSVWAQDTWAFAPQLEADAGPARRALAGRRTALDRRPRRRTLGFAERSETYVSPKAALA